LNIPPLVYKFGFKWPIKNRFPGYFLACGGQCLSPSTAAGWFHILLASALQEPFAIVVLSGAAVAHYNGAAYIMALVEAARIELAYTFASTSWPTFVAGQLLFDHTVQMPKTI
jgi:hypothetical protein